MQGECNQGPELQAGCRAVAGLGAHRVTCCMLTQPFDEAAVDAATAAVWRQVWPAQRLRQREFFSFGMEVLLKLDLQVGGWRPSAADPCVAGVMGVAPGILHCNPDLHACIAPLPPFTLSMTRISS